jgi:PAS domain S-box-containing protein
MLAINMLLHCFFAGKGGRRWMMNQDQLIRDLEQQKRFLKTMIDAVPDLIFYKDLDGVYLGCNEAFAATFVGMTEAEIVGKTDYDLFPDAELAEFFRTQDRKMMRQGQVRINEEQVKLIDGRVIDLETMKTPFFDEQGGIAGLIGVSREITARKQTEVKLRESELRLSLATAAARIGLWDWSIPENTIILNEEWAGLIGYRLSEISPVSIDTWRSFVHPEDLPVSQELLQKCLLGERAYYECEVRMRHRSGAWIWVLDRGRVIVRDAHGSPVRMLGTHIDITPQKRFAEELAVAKLQAEQANQYKGRFLANMSHEIRTPMNAVLGFLELLSMADLADEPMEDVRDALSASQMLLRIIDDILDFSKIEAGMLRIAPRPFALLPCLQSLITMHRRRAEQKNLQLFLDLAGDLPEKLFGDDARLSQVLNNLLSNAIKFTKLGEVRLKVAVAEETSSGLLLTFRITDTGIGLSVEDGEKLFQPFTQADESTTRLFGGTGLGLVISRELVRLMGGDIAFESSLGLGSEFFFTLPFAPVADGVVVEVSTNLECGVATAEAFPHKKTSTASGRPQILVVEDNEMSLKLIKTMLSRSGYSCDAVNNGVEAMDALLIRPYEVILMDCQMPLMDGYECARRIRTLPGSRSSPLIIALTANAMETDRQRCLDAGMDAYFAKPVDFKDLINLISEKVTKDKVKSVQGIQGVWLAEFVEKTGLGWQEAEDLFSEYLTDLPRQVEILAAFVVGNNVEAARKMGHQLCGGLQNFYIHEGSKQAEAILEALHAVDIELAQKHLSKLRQLLQV